MTSGPAPPAGEAARPREPSSRRALERWLAERGLTRTEPSAAWRRLDPTAPDRAARLGGALADLGPAGAAFARYLSSRVDLFGTAVRDELELAAGRTRPLPLATVDALLRQELRDDPHRTFQSLEPMGTSPLFQWHRAERPGGARVILKLVRPETDALRRDGAQMLRWLVACLPPSWPDLAAALGDFTSLLERRIDLRREGAELLGLAPEAFAPLQRTDVSARLCWYEAPAGRALSEDLAAAGPAGDGPRARSVTTGLCRAWLQQALLGERCPEEVDPEDVWTLEGERVALAGGAFCELRPEARLALQIHLSAASRQEPDAAALALLRVMTPSSGALGSAELRLRFRQAEPFREGLGFAPYRGRRIADLLFVLWRQARDVGYVPADATLGFFRGIAGLERLARRLDEASDALGRALDDVRVLAAVRDVTALLGPSRLPGTLARSLPPVLELMRRAERAALLGETAHAPDSDEGGEDGPPRSRWLAASGALALFVSVAILGARLLPALLGAEAGQRAAAALVVLAGGLAFWVVARGQS